MHCLQEGKQHFVLQRMDEEIVLDPEQVVLQGGTVQNGIAGEQYLLNRLQREGKNGHITRIAPNTFVYETDVFDANEMLPWIRTFTGRILSLESDWVGSETFLRLLKERLLRQSALDAV